MNQKAYLNHPKLGMKIPVVIVEEREIFGREEYGCVPVQGVEKSYFTKEKFEFVDRFDQPTSAA